MLTSGLAWLTNVAYRLLNVLMNYFEHCWFFIWSGMPACNCPFS